MPMTYSDSEREAIQAVIVDELAVGVPLAEICRREGFPDRVTIYRWRDEDATFAQHIARAREAGFDAIAEQCLEIADDTSFDTKIVGDDEREVANSEFIQRSKLRVETRLKLLSKWDPKRYGEKVQHTGDGGGPIDASIAIRFIDE